MTRVSVTMVNRNKASSIRRAVESVLWQEWQDFELIFVDDASTDGSLTVVRSFDDPRLRVIALPRNLGVGAARNVALEAANGDLVAVLDSDDIAYPERLGAQLEAFDRDPSLVLCAAYAVIDDAEGRVLRQVFPSGDHEELASLILCVCPFVHSSVMFRRVVGGRPVRYKEWRNAEDYQLYFDLLREGRFTAVPRLLTGMRQLPGGLSESGMREQASNAALARSAFLRSLGLGDPAWRRRLLRGAAHALDRGPLTAEDPLSEALERLFASRAPLDCRGLLLYGWQWENLLSSTLKVWPLAFHLLRDGDPRNRYYLPRTLARRTLKALAGRTGFLQGRD